MKIFLNRKLPDDALSQFRIRDMRPGETITVLCDSVAEYNAARRTAQAAKLSMDKPDGYDCLIKSKSKENAVIISLEKDEPKTIEPKDGDE